MSMELYYKSINDELKAIKNRVTFLIGNTHHPTVGSYHESLLKDLILQHLPENIGISRGFVVFNQRYDLSNESKNFLEYNSNEMDIILYDKTKPTLYKSLDLVIVDVHSVKGVIEVKKTVNRNILNSTIKKLSNNVKKINSLKNDSECIFSGIFAFNIKGNVLIEVLEDLNKSISHNKKSVINHLCLSEKSFVKFWDHNPFDTTNTNYNHWHLYELNEDLAMGYFIFNLITFFNKTDDSIFFPKVSKELSFVNKKEL